MQTACIRLLFLVWAIVVFLGYPARSFCQIAQPDKPLVLDSETRGRIVDTIIRELQARYVALEKINAIQSLLRTKLQSGSYDQLVTPDRFAATLTQDLRTSSNDLHLFVTYDPALERD